MVVTDERFWDMESTQTYLDRINAIGLNIVTCGECEFIIIVASGQEVNEHTCRFCGFTDDIGCFPDYFEPDYDQNVSAIGSPYSEHKEQEVLPFPVVAIREIIRRHYAEDEVLYQEEIDSDSIVITINLPIGPGVEVYSDAAEIFKSE